MWPATCAACSRFVRSCEPRRPEPSSLETMTTIDSDQLATDQPSQPGQHLEPALRQQRDGRERQRVVERRVDQVQGRRLLRVGGGQVQVDGQRGRPEQLERPGGVGGTPEAGGRVAHQQAAQPGLELVGHRHDGRQRR